MSITTKTFILKPSFVYISLAILLIGNCISEKIEEYSKEQFYTFLQSSCYQIEIFNEIFTKYNPNQFSWGDLYNTATYDQKNLFMKKNSLITYEQKKKSAYNFAFSSIEAIDFYNLYYLSRQYQYGENSKSTFLYNKDGRDYLPYMDGCALEINSMSANQLFYNVEYLNHVTKGSFSITSKESFTFEILSLTYQIGRSLLYLFQNNYHYLKLDESQIYFWNFKGLNIYKLKNPLKIRYSCDPSQTMDLKNSKKLLNLFSTNISDENMSEIQDIQYNLNLCANSNIKQLLVTVEKVSKFLSFGNLKFSWAACFGSESDYCPDSLKVVMRENPKEALTLAKVLNGEHYSENNYIQSMLDLLNLFGKAIDPNFKIYEVVLGGNSTPVKLERFMKNHTKIVDNSTTTFESQESENRNTTKADELAKKYITDAKIYGIDNQEFLDLHAKIKENSQKIKLNEEIINPTLTENQTEQLEPIKSDNQTSNKIII